MLRSIIAVIAGLIAGSIVIYLIELAGHALYPPPELFDPMDREAAKEMMDAAPIGSLLMVILAYLVGSFAGGAVAALVPAKSRLSHSLATGLILMVFGIINLVLLPHPVWFWVLSLIVFVPFAFLGGQAVVRRSLRDPDKSS